METTHQEKPPGAASGPSPAYTGEKTGILRLVWRCVCMALLLSPVVYRAFLQVEKAIGDSGTVVIQYMAWSNPQQLEIERKIIAGYNERCRADGKNVRVELFMCPLLGY